MDKLARNAIDKEIGFRKSEYSSRIQTRNEYLRLAAESIKDSERYVSDANIQSKRTMALSKEISELEESRKKL